MTSVHKQFLIAMVSALGRVFFALVTLLFGFTTVSTTLFVLAVVRVLGQIEVNASRIILETLVPASKNVTAPAALKAVKDEPGL